MARYSSSPEYRQDCAERIGVLLVDAGTPVTPGYASVLRLLARRLSDPRAVELPRALWLPLLYGALLPLRAWRDARRYRRIWADGGAPLRAGPQELRAAIADALGSRMVAPLAIETATLHSAPAIPLALRRLRAAGAHRILVLPLSPQYSASTSAAAFDQVNAELARWRWLPEMRFIADYHDHPGYIEALRASLAGQWDLGGRPQHLLLSFQGLPESRLNRGDPYYGRCLKTARLLADELNLGDGDWSVSFQGPRGPGRWLGPHTGEVLGQLPGRGIRSVTVLCPGHPLECLETLAGIGAEGRERFLAGGGRRFQYLPAASGRELHAAALADLIAQHCQGWTTVNVGWLAAANDLRGVRARGD